MKDKLEQAIVAIQSGNKARGIELLMQITQREPTNEKAWMWLAYAVKELTLKKFCVEWILEEINPNNAQVQRWLKKFDGVLLPFQPFGESCYTMGVDREFRKVPPPSFYEHLIYEIQGQSNIEAQGRLQIQSGHQSASSLTKKKVKTNNRSKFLAYAAFDIIFGLWVYYGITSGNPDLLIWALLSLAAYGFWMNLTSRVAKAIFSIRGEKASIFLTFILLGILGPVIHFIDSISRFFTASDD